ncbi:MAG: hydrogenase expression/formation protein HypE [Arcobacteraceae bacterium]
MNKTIQLANGNGGKENNQLIQEVFFKAFANDILAKSEDGAVLEDGIVFSTDSFTVSPLFFAGGDIGKLSICGTCNDLAMMGAKPKYLSVGFIIEEGLDVAILETITESMKKELEINGAVIVSGDTKVVPKGSVDKLFINTSGIGKIECEGISCQNINEGDIILVSRDIARHGACIFAAREGIELSSDIKSDCASLYPLIKALIDSGIKPKALRDATRGGVAAVLNEWANSSDICIEVEENAIPISDEVKGICEILGFDPMILANEGTFVLAVSPNDAQKALELLRKFEICTNAAIIGKATNAMKKKVILNSNYGTKKPLDMPSGEILPRIC